MEHAKILPNLMRNQGGLSFLNRYEERGERKAPGGKNYRIKKRSNLQSCLRVMIALFCKMRLVDKLNIFSVIDRLW